jgi:hypothetical protein
MLIMTTASAGGALLTLKNQAHPELADTSYDFAVSHEQSSV